jgi:membrane protein
MTSAGQETEPSDAGRTRRNRVLHHARRGSDAAKEKYTGSSAEHLWQRLDSMDFINRGMLFAATLLLCFFPFLIIANALAGRSAASGLARHLGLNKQAAADVGQLFTSTTATSNAITGTAWLFFVLGGVAAATAVQGLYERAFDLEARGMKDIIRRLIWLAVLVGSSVLAGWAGPYLHHHGGPLLLAILGLAALTGFWWFSLWLLLGGRIPWRNLFPSAMATAVCWLGMEIVFSFTFSSEIITDDTKYGPIGVVFALMSWLIAIGVVIILGAVFGVVWRERGMSFSAAFQKLRRRPKTQASSVDPVE